MKHTAIFSLLLTVLLTACMPTELPVAARTSQPYFTDCCLIASDGTKLHYQTWKSNKPKAIIIGLHGFNDYSHSFKLLGEAMQEKGITTIAFDQRGFGKNSHQGIWASSSNLVEDTKDAIAATNKQYPDTPIYLLGNSMGSAIIVELLHQYPNIPIQGSIFNAPAIWGGSTVHPIHRIALDIAAHTIPNKTFTGEGFKIQASDNIEILKEMGKDPYVIKSSRVDSIYGLANLMEQAYQHKYVLRNKPALLLYGLKDQVVPPAPIYHLARYLPEKNTRLYENGYHMLLRDKQRAKVFDDITTWIFDDNTDTSQ